VAIAVAEVAVAVAPRRTEEGVRMGEELEAIRRDRSLTQQQLADRLGMSLQGYLNYRKGYGRVTRNTLPKWAKAFGVTVADLASRLKIDLLAEPDASSLRQQVAALMPDADAADVDDLVRRLATLPDSDRKQVLDGWRDHLTGRRARCSSSATAPAPIAPGPIAPGWPPAAPRRG
jgi:transcriptional regulator with XRE-family HTH domain